MMAIRTTAFAVSLLGIVPSAAPCLAQAWPQRSVKFIVPFGPGAGADIGARLFADRLSALWAKPVVVDLRNIYRPDDMAAHGFTYDSVGRGSETIV